jgi:glycosyltransferase involved in cell wall biosynthesis
VAAEAGATVLVQSPNQGKGAALRRGLLHGVAEGYRAVLTLDADGQHRPDEIPRFLEAHDTTGADLIIGYRSFREMPPVRRFGNTVGTWLFSQAVGRRIADNQSGYRLLRAGLIESLDWSSVGFEMEVEMIVQAVAQGRELGWVPISTIYGDERSHFRPMEDSVGFLRTVLRARRRVRRSS